MSDHAPRLRRALALMGPFLGLLLVFGLFAALEPNRFLSIYNFKTIATQTVIVGLGAMGMTFVIVSGGIDLSVGSVIALCSVVIALLLDQGMAAPWAVGAALLAGALVGWVNGVLITRISIVPFIATLGTMGIARGLAKYLAGEQKVDAPAEGIAGWMAKSPEPTWLMVAPGIWLMMGLALLLAATLRRTVFGTHTIAIGSNEATARLCGVRVARVKISVYVLCGLLAGLAGVMQFARLTVGDPTTALGKELDVIAAVVIGGGSLSGGSGSIAGSIVGAFFMSILANGCTLVGVPNYVQEILIGTIIVVAVAFDRFRSASD